MSFTGKVIAAPFVSSIRSACSRGRYTTELARASVFAARFPARDARTKLERSSLSIHRGIVRDLGILTKRLGYWDHQNCPKFERDRLRELAEVIVLDGGRYWARTSDLCRVKRK